MSPARVTWHAAGFAASHLYYTLWVNRSQPVDGYRLPESASAKGEQPEQIYPNIQPTRVIET